MSKFSLIARLQHWMDSVPGQTFMNYAYSWGAAVVILGTLFKLTHIPGANLMLFIGMGTEVFVFFISGFDRPFDAKGETELNEEFVSLDEMEALKAAAQAAAEAGAGSGQPVVVGGGGGTVISGGGGTVISGGAPVAAGGEGTVVAGGGVIGGGGGGTVIIGGGGAPAGGTVVIGGGAVGGGVPAGEEGEFVGGGVISGGGGVIGGGGPGLSAEDAANLAAAAQAAASAASLGQEAQNLLTNAQAANAPEVEDAIEAYVDQLQQLTEVLGKVREQASRMTQDSEEMVNLNRTLTGINTIYEMQLKSISQQVGTIDQINDQTRKMARQIEELNAVYARMIEALTVNMPKGAAPQV